MKLVFTLRMPRANTPGGWTGADKVYARVFPLASKAATREAEALATPGRYGYDFGGGWCASVRVQVVDDARGRAVKKASVGFAGYDWMIDSIRRLGSICSLPCPRTRCMCDYHGGGVVEGPVRAHEHWA
jgi:hypothetical protein